MRDPQKMNLSIIEYVVVVSMAFVTGLIWKEGMGLSHIPCRGLRVPMLLVFYLVLILQLLQNWWVRKKKA